MNTKGIKFLAVLAVLAMAFAVFAVMEENDAAEKTATNSAKWKAASADAVGPLDFAVVDTVLTADDLSNATLGNNILVEYDASTMTYKVTGTLNKQGDGATAFNELDPPEGYHYGLVFGIKVDYVDSVRLIGNLDKTFDYSLDDGTESFLMYIKDKKGFKVYITDNEDNTTVYSVDTSAVTLASDVGPYTGYTAIANTNALAGVAADIENGSDGAAGTFSWDNTEKILTLNGYNGKEYFMYTAALNVEVVGTNTITVALEKEQDRGLGSHPTGATTIHAALDASLTVDVTKASYAPAGAKTLPAISSAGALTVSAEEGKTLTIKASAPYAGLYSSGLMTLTNAVITATSGEKAVNAAGIIDMNNSQITAKIGEMFLNGMGDDKRFGVRTTATLDMDATSTITTQGLLIQGNQTTAALLGKISVTGDYEQSYPTYIAGFQYGTADAEYKLNAYTGIDPAAGKIIVDSAENVKGYVEVINAGGSTEKKEKEIVPDTGAATATTIKTLVEDASKAEVVDAYISSGEITLDVAMTADKTLILNTSESGKVSGVVKFKDDASNSITLDKVTGSIRIIKGSIYIDDAEITGGSITLAEGADVKLTGSMSAAFAINVAENKNATVTIPEDKIFEITGNKTLTLGKGVTLNVEGILKGTVADSTVTGEYKVFVKDGGYVNSITFTNTASKTATVTAESGSEVAGTVTFTGSSKFVAKTGSDISELEYGSTWDFIEGTDDASGTWTFDKTATTLNLKNYNGSYNFGSFADKLTAIKLTGDNKITGAFDSDYDGTGATLFGKTNGISSITTVTAGSLEIDADISKVPTDKMFSLLTPLTIINGADKLTINGVDVKISVTGSNNTWKADDIKGMCIGGIKVGDDELSLFQTDIVMDIMSAYDAMFTIGIIAGNADVSASTSSFDIKAAVGIVADAGTFMATYAVIDGDAVFEDDVSITNKSTIAINGDVEIGNDADPESVAKDTVEVAQESILAVKGLVLEAIVTNDGKIEIGGDAVIKGAITNNALIVNAGNIGVYAGAFTNNGAFANDGTFTVYAKKAVAGLDADLQINDTEEYQKAIGSKILLKKITLSAVSVELNADGSADVVATLDFIDKDGNAFVPKTEDLLVFTGKLTPSQLKAGEYDLVLNSETAKVSVKYKAVTGGDAHVGSNYTISVSGGILNGFDTLVYIENNQAKSGTTIAGAAIVEDGFTAWTADATGSFLNKDGTTNNTKNFTLFKAGEIDKSAATFEGPITLYADAIIAGTFNGDITSKNDVTSSKKVVGNITTDGKVSVKDMAGNITAKGDVTVTGTLAGDITTKGNVTVKSIIGDITMNAGAKNLTFSNGGKALGILTYNSEYLAKKDDTAKTVFVNKLGFVVDTDKDVKLAMIAGVDAEGTTDGKPGYFAFGAAPVALGDEKGAGFSVTEGIFGVDTSVTLKAGYELVIEKDVTLEVAKIATLDATEAALVVSKDAIRHYEVGPDAAITYGKVDCIMSFETAAGYYIYSDVAFALSNSDENATLTVEKNAPINTAVAVKNGVNIIVKNVTLTFNGKNVEMGDGAKITLEGTGKVIFKETGNNGLPADEPWEFYTVSGTIVYEDNAVVFEDVRFTNEADSVITGIAATASAGDKISTNLYYNEGKATISAGTGTGSITLGNGSYKLQEDDVAPTLVFATFIVGENAVFDAVSLKDAFCTVDYTKETAEADLVIKDYKLMPTIVGVEGTLNLLDSTKVKGVYSGLGVITLAAGKEFILDKSAEEPAGGPYPATYENITIPGVVAAKVVDTTDDQNGYVFNLVSASPNTSLVMKATTYKIGTETVNVMTMSGNVASGIVTATTGAFIDKVTLEDESALVADVTYVIGDGASTAKGYLTTKVIFMKEEGVTGYQKLNYQVTFEKEDYTVFTYFANVDFDLVDEVTIADNANLSTLTKTEGTANARIDLSGSDVTIIVAEGKALTVDRILILGTPITYLGDDDGSALVGKFIIANGKYIVAYSDVDLTLAEIVQAADAKTAAVYSTLTVEEVLYATIFANDNNVVLSEADKKIVPEIEGYIFTQWINYGPAAANVGDTNAYAGAMPSLVYVTVKFVEGVSYYCDGVEFAIYDTPTKVQYNSVFTAKINNTAKYEGTPVINGKNSFIVTEDSVLVASGVSPIPVPPEPEPVIGDSGISLTDILLIVLVVLIAIMVVILVLRLNRS